MHLAAHVTVSSSASFTRSLFIQGTDVDTPCPEHENGTALHISAANLSLGAARVLLAYGADPDIRDDLARMPIG